MEDVRPQPFFRHTDWRYELPSDTDSAASVHVLPGMDPVKFCAMARQLWYLDGSARELLGTIGGTPTTYPEDVTAALASEEMGQGSPLFSGAEDVQLELPDEVEVPGYTRPVDIEQWMHIDHSDQERSVGELYRGELGSGRVRRQVLHAPLTMGLDFVDTMGHVNMHVWDDYRVRVGEVFTLAFLHSAPEASVAPDGDLRKRGVSVPNSLYMALDDPNIQRVCSELVLVGEITADEMRVLNEMYDYRQTESSIVYERDITKLDSQRAGALLRKIQLHTDTKSRQFNRKPKAVGVDITNEPDNWLAVMRRLPKNAVGYQFVDQLDLGVPILRAVATQTPRTPWTQIINQGNRAYNSVQQWTNGDVPDSLYEQRYARLHSFVVQHGVSGVKTALKRIDSNQTNTIASHVINKKGWAIADLDSDIANQQPEIASKLRSVIRHLEWAFQDDDELITTLQFEYYRELREFAVEMDDIMAESLIGTTPGEGKLPRSSALGLLFLRANGDKQRIEQIVERENARRQIDKFGPELVEYSLYRLSAKHTYEDLETLQINSELPIEYSPHEVTAELRAAINVAIHGMSSGEAEKHIRGVLAETPTINDAEFYIHVLMLWLPRQHSHDEMYELLIKKFKVDNKLNQRQRVNKVHHWIAEITNNESLRHAFLSTDDKTWLERFPVA